MQYILYHVIFILQVLPLNLSHLFITSHRLLSSGNHVFVLCIYNFPFGYVCSFIFFLDSTHQIADL